ncbi:diguanylate cyclase [Acidovorax sp. DW039]|uniref:sensor domain-containing diguanylate cyclase n=1 Tax=Acidovorax sp. DW039 TaxID=3095606 RepID=UPI003092315D|nr:diguanylate cyclase [Acidovorax sp. DW039]
MPGRSLRTQIALVFGILVVALSVLLSIGFGEVVKRRIQRDVGTSLQTLADATASLLAAGLYQRVREVQVLASSEVLWKSGLDSPQVLQLLARQQAIHPQSLWLGVTDAQGVVHAASGNMLLGQNVSERPWFQAGLKGPHVGDVHPAKLLESLLPPSKSGEPYRFVDFAAPIRLSGKTVGVLGVHGYWEWVNEMIQTLMPVDARQDQLEVFIFDKTGQLIHAPADQQTLLQRLGQKLPDERFYKVPSDTARADQTAVVRWADGQRYLTSHARLQARSAESDMGWHIVARMPVDIAFAEATQAVYKALLGGFIAAVVTSLLAWMAAGRLSEDLNTLARAAQDLEAGNPKATIPTAQSSLEVRRLSSALRDMTQRLLTAHGAMEAQVQLRTQQLEQANRELDLQARSDPLTGLLNRRGFDAQMAYALALARRSGRPLSIVTMDVDHFKQINDTYGHEAGDHVLQRLAQTLMQRLRDSDVVARLGGEEFAALLQDTDIAGARAIAQALVDAIGEQRDPVAGHFTISAGVATLRGMDDLGSALLRRGDEALYEAKRAGRNRVVVQA